MPTVWQLGMRRKIQIVLANGLLVAALVCSGSYIYVSQTLRQRVTTAHENATYLNSQIAYLAANTILYRTITLERDAPNPAKARQAIADQLATNLDLNTMLESVVSNWPMIYDAAVVDADGKAILHSNPNLLGKVVPDRPDFGIVQDAKFRRQLHLVYNPPTIYDVCIPLQLSGEPFGSIRLGISTIFLRSEITPRLEHAVIFSGISILHSLLLAVGLSYIALGPPPGANQPPPGGETGDEESDFVTLKIANLESCANPVGRGQSSSTAVSNIPNAVVPQSSSG
jgi:hypothetical protein